MTQTFAQDVFIDGSADAAQLRVQGHSTQTQPLQTWEDGTGVVLTRLTSGGKLQIGDLGLSTPEALVEASADITPSSVKPKRGIHALGRFTGAQTGAITWAVHEMEFTGSGGITTLQTGLRAKITNDNTGTISNAELRAAEFQTTNQRGSGANVLRQITGVRSSVTNSATAYTAKAVAVEAAITNDSAGNLTDASAFEVAQPTNLGALTNLYGLKVPDLTQGANNFPIYTGLGVVHIGDHQELRLLSSTPSANPPANFIRLYPKLVGGVPTLYAKDSGGTEYVVGGSGGAATAPLTLTGTANVVQFQVKAFSSQTNNVLQVVSSTDQPLFLVSGTGKITANSLQLSGGSGAGLFLQSDANGNASWLPISAPVSLVGSANAVQFQVKGFSTQTSNVIQVVNSADLPLFTVGGTGATQIVGRGDSVQLLVKGNATQTADLQQWQNSSGTVVGQISSSGKLTISAAQLTGGAGAGLFLQSDASGNASWKAISPPLNLTGTGNAVQLQVKGFSTQTSNVLQVVNSSDQVLFSVSGTGASLFQGRSDSVQLIVKGHSTQTQDLFQLKRSDDIVLSSFRNSGSWRVIGLTDDTRYFAKAIASQSSDMLQLVNSADALLFSVGGTGATQIIGRDDNIQLRVRGNNPQVNDVLRLEDQAQNTLFSVGGTGAALIVGRGDNVQLRVRANNSQVNDVLRVDDALQNVLFSVGGSGATQIIGRDNRLQLNVRGAISQTANLQEWQDNWGGVMASVSSSGKLTANSLAVINNAVAGQYLRTDAFGNATWQPIAAPIDLVGSTNVVQLRLKGNSVQIEDLLQLVDASGASLFSVGGTGATLVTGRGDNVQLLVRGNNSQVNDVFRLEDNGQATLFSVGGSGATQIIGRGDYVQLKVRANNPQVNDVFRLEDASTSVLLSVSGTGATQITGRGDNVQLRVLAANSQTQDSFHLEDMWGNPNFTVGSSGATGIFGQADNIQLRVRAHNIQTNDLLRLEDRWENLIFSVSSEGATSITGATSIIGRGDNVQLFVKGSFAQTANIQEWQDNWGGLLAALSITGKLTINDLRIVNGAGTGKVLQSDANGNASWQTPGTGGITSVGLTAPSSVFSVAGSPVTSAGTLALNFVNQSPNRLFAGPASGGAAAPTFRALVAADISGPLAAPPAIGGTTPAAGTFTTLTTNSIRIITGAAAGKVLQSDASGNATWQSPSSGSVTSVALSAPSSLFSVAGSPVTAAGTLAISLVNQNANQVLAGPASGGAAVPTFRALAAADLTAPLASPPAIGGTAPAAGTFTALTGTSVIGAVSDAGTNTVVNTVTARHNSSTTPVAGFGTGILFTGKSSTTNDQSQGRVRTMWVDPTHATRQAKLVISAFDTAERDVIAVQASGTAPMLGFLGATPVIRQTGGVKTAAATYSANEQSMLQTVYNALRTFGLLT